MCWQLVSFSPPLKHVQVFVHVNSTRTHVTYDFAIYNLNAHLFVNFSTLYIAHCMLAIMYPSCWVPINTKWFSDNVLNLFKNVFDHYVKQHWTAHSTLRGSIFYWINISIFHTCHWWSNKTIAPPAGTSNTIHYGQDLLFSSLFCLVKFSVSPFWNTFFLPCQRLSLHVCWWEGHWPSGHLSSGDRLIAPAELHSIHTQQATHAYFIFKIGEMEKQQGMAWGADATGKGCHWRSLCRTATYKCS